MARIVKKDGIAVERVFDADGHAYEIRRRVFAGFQLPAQYEYDESEDHEDEKRVPAYKPGRADVRVRNSELVDPKDREGAIKAAQNLGVQRRKAQADKEDAES